MTLYQIYELTPAPWGDDYRLVEQYDNIKDAGVLLRCLNKLDTTFSYYKIIKLENPNEETT